MAEQFSDQGETFQSLVCNFVMELCAICPPDCTITHVEEALWVLPALTTAGSSHTQPCHCPRAGTRPSCVGPARDRELSWCQTRLLEFVSLLCKPDSYRNSVLVPVLVHLQHCLVLTPSNTRASILCWPTGDNIQQVPHCRQQQTACFAFHVGFSLTFEPCVGLSNIETLRSCLGIMSSTKDCFPPCP